MPPREEPPTPPTEPERSRSEPAAPDPNPDPGGLTQLLRRASTGDGSALDAAVPRVQRELWAIARRRMAGERRDHTLQPTALVNEAWMRLLGDQEIEWASRVEFFKAAAESMRRILIDHARARARLKRGGVRRRMDIPLDELAGETPEQFLALDEEIQKLEDEDPRAAAVVRLRFFAGLSVDETAESLGLSRRTVLREWSYARARLFAALNDEDLDAGALSRPRGED